MILTLIGSLLFALHRHEYKPDTVLSRTMACTECSMARSQQNGDISSSSYHRITLVAKTEQDNAYL